AVIGHRLPYGTVGIEVGNIRRVEKQLAPDAQQCFSVMKHRFQPIDGSGYADSIHHKEECVKTTTLELEVIALYNMPYTTPAHHHTSLRRQLQRRHVQPLHL